MSDVVDFILRLSPIFHNTGYSRYNPPYPRPCFLQEYLLRQAAHRKRDRNTPATFFYPDRHGKCMATLPDIYSNDFPPRFASEHGFLIVASWKIRVQEASIILNDILAQVRFVVNTINDKNFIKKCSNCVKKLRKRRDTGDWKRYMTDNCIF